MPEDDKKTVDLDTSGPGARVELPETENENDKTYENEVKKNEANVRRVLLQLFPRKVIFRGLTTFSIF